MTYLFDNFWAQRYDSIENGIFFYLVKISDSPALYKLSVLPKECLEELAQLSSDPKTRQKEFWLIPYRDIKSISLNEMLRQELFRKAEENEINQIIEAYQQSDLSTTWILKENALDTEKVALLFGVDPNTKESNQFDEEKNKVFIDFKHDLTSNDTQKIISTLEWLGFTASIMLERKQLTPLQISYILPSVTDLFESDNRTVINLAVQAFVFLVRYKDYWDYCDKDRLSLIIPSLLKFVVSSTKDRDSIRREIKRRIARLQDAIDAAIEYPNNPPNHDRLLKSPHQEEDPTPLEYMGVRTTLCIIMILAYDQDNRSVFKNPKCILLLVESLKTSNDNTKKELINLLKILVYKDAMVQDMIREANGLPILLEQIAAYYAQSKLTEVASCIKLLRLVINKHDTNTRLIYGTHAIPLLIDCSQAEDTALSNEAMSLLLKIYEHNQSIDNPVYQDFMKRYDEILSEMQDTPPISMMIQQIKMNLISFSHHQISRESFLKNVNNIKMKLEPENNTFFADPKYTTLCRQVKRQTTQLINTIAHDEPTILVSKSNNMG